MGDSRQIAFIHDAIDEAERVLATLPATAEARHLLEVGRALRAQADEWRTTPPANDVRERVMRRVLGLHKQVAKLRRASNPGDPGA